MVKSVAFGLILLSFVKSRNCLELPNLLDTLNLPTSNTTDALTRVEQYIAQFGYPLESHNITTEDGYILTYHRIPHGKDSNSTSGRHPVLVHHGLLASSPAWVLANYSLGFALADAGFDVWLGNARGNTYSRKHIKYDPDQDKSKFWDFSFHEMGYYDLPASIDYILKKTNKEQLSYIGHSMGTTMFFVLGATRPEYMDKVQAAVMMAPVAFPRNIRSPLLKFLSSLHSVLSVSSFFLGKALGMYEMFPYSNSIYWINQNICLRPQSQFICKDLMFYLGGFVEKELNRTSLETVLQFMPSGTSFKTLKHLRQLTSTDSNFGLYDEGYMGVGNMWKYRSLKPPSYNLSNVNAPVYAYYAMNDWLVVPEDAKYVVERLPNVKLVKKVPDDQFNHLDFMWATDAKTLLYDDIISILQSANADSTGNHSP